MITQHLGETSPIIHLNHCGVSPLSVRAEAAVQRCARDFQEWVDPLCSGGGAPTRIRVAASQLLRVGSESLAFIPNSAHGLNVIAHGLRLSEGDEIVSYQYEYPSNHYPWVVQRRRGVRLVTFAGRCLDGRPLSFSVDDVRRVMTARTRVLAISHVQFTSGFVADLEELGQLCQERGVFLVVDAAQSIGALPVHPERVGVDALVTSGWKWLRGPVGSGILYANARIREAIDDIWCGPDMMCQGEDYLNHRWQPFSDARRFEFSTLPVFSTVGLAAALEEHLSVGGDEYVWRALQERQYHFLEGLAGIGLAPVAIPSGAGGRGGILSFLTPGHDPEIVAKGLVGRRIICSSRGGYLRFAPHHDTRFGDLDEAVRRIGQFLGELGGRSKIMVHGHPLVSSMETQLAT